MSVLPSFYNQVVTDWEALTPPTDVTITYHQVADRTSALGESGHRSFRFGLPTRGLNVNMSDTTETVQWFCTATLFLSDSGLSIDALADMVANEVQLLLGTVNTRTSWPAGIIEVFVDETDDPDELESGDIEITMNLRVTAGESK